MEPVNSQAIPNIGRLKDDRRREIEASLDPGERLLLVLPGPVGDALLVTDHRLGKAHRGLLGGRTKLAWWPVLNVRAITLNDSTFNPHLRVELLGQVAQPSFGSEQAISVKKTMAGKTDFGDVTLEQVHDVFRQSQESARARGEQPDEPPGSEALRDATANWQLPSLVRTYDRTSGGEGRLRAEMDVLGLHDYRPFTQSEDGGHVHVGRLLVTGGFSVLAGRRGIRSKGSLTVTYRRGELDRPAPELSDVSDDPAARLRRLASLRDEGILTDDEFAAKKADIVADL
jgi:hypothetical protein